MRAFITILSSLALIGLPPATAQNALRAPLQIVPAPMQAAIEQIAIQQAVSGKTPANAQSKLAPRVAARQMKRAIRAVAATPGADGDVVQIGQLGALEDAPVGLEKGFGDAVWTGARLAFVADQMARLSDNLAMPALYQLERQLHRSATAAPIGTADKTSWFATRLMRLLTLGDTQSVIALEAETGAARSDGYVARVLVLAHLGRGDRAAACAVPRPPRGTKGRRDTIEFFMQMLVFCQLLEGAYEKAGLTLELNTKSLGEDELFRDMAYLMSAQVPLTFGTKEDVAAAEADGSQAPIVLPDELTPMQIALLQLAGQALPQGLINLPNYFMQAVAMDFAQAPLVQLSAAHLAVRFGASPEVFSQAAQLADLSAVSGVLPSPEPEADAIFLAQALRIIDAADEQAQPRLVALYLRQARARDLWHDMIAVLDDRLLALLVPQAALPELPQDLSQDSPEASQMTDLLSESDLSFGTVIAPEANTLDTNPLDINEADTITPPAAVETVPAPLAEADRMILLLAQWQAGNRAAADNLLNLGPVSEDVQILAQWQGFEEDAARELAGDALLAEPMPFGDRPVNNIAGLDANNLPAIGEGQTSDATLVQDPVEATFLTSDALGLPDLAMNLQPDWAVFEARFSTAAPAEALYMRRQLALYHALGVALPESLMSDLVLPEDNPVAQRLARLAENKWIGDLILAQIAELADKPADSYDALDTNLLIGTLWRAGLQDAAENMAAQMLLSHMAQLAITEPHLLTAQTALPFQSEPFPFPLSQNLTDGQ